jgi:hypothetical protein
MNIQHPILPLLVLLGWLGFQGLAPTPMMACDSATEAQSMGKSKGK